MLSRRNFLQTSTLAIVGSIGLAGSDKVFAAIPGIGSSTYAGAPAAHLTSELFAGLVNTNFSIRGGLLKGKAALRLIDVKNFDHACGPTGGSYSLLFEGPGRLKIERGIYDFSHESLGVFSFYIGPVTQDANIYEVIVANSPH